MIKTVLLMVLCSGLAGNECKVIPTPKVLFDDYSSCIVYGYEYSHNLMASLTQNGPIVWKLILSFHVNQIKSYKLF